MAPVSVIVPKPKPARKGASPPPAMLLAVDIGNTQTCLGIFEGSEIRDLFRITSSIPRTGDELLPLVRAMVAPYREGLSLSGRGVIGSVVPALTGSWVDLVLHLLGREALLITAGEVRGIAVDVRDPSEVGADRIANAVAASAEHRLPAIVVDLGTATTFDVVLPGPRYVGGAIAPGILTGAEELFRRGARLAKVEIVRPSSAVGRSTQESLQSGVFYGAVAIIDGLVRRISRELRIKPVVIATGGLAESVARDSETIQKVDPALTLKGLRILEERGRDERTRRRPG